MIEKSPLLIRSLFVIKIDKEIPRQTGTMRVRDGYQLEDIFLTYQIWSRLSTNRLSRGVIRGGILRARVARSSRFANFGSKVSILREVSP